jgi:hypothetical protein
MYAAKSRQNPFHSSNVHNEQKNGDLSEDQKSTEMTDSVRLLYMEAFKRVAKKYNVVIGIRAPNPLGEMLLNENYPSKNFHMKAKSSSTGPTAGFIAENPIYSKVPVSAYQKQSNYIKTAMSKGAKAIDLIISEARIKALIETGDLHDLGGGQYSANYPDGLQKFIITDDGHVLDDKSKHASPRAITADYDLFTIIPRENQSINVRPLMSAPKTLKGNFKFDFLKPRALQGQDEDANMGNLHIFGQVIVKALNKEIAYEGYQGGKLVWHNDETGNPFSPGFDPADKPIFIHPVEQAVQVHSVAELLDYYEKLKKQKFSPEYSPIFGF